MSSANATAYFVIATPLCSMYSPNRQNCTFLEPEHSGRHVEEGQSSGFQLQTYLQSFLLTQFGVLLYPIVHYIVLTQIFRRRWLIRFWNHCIAEGPYKYGIMGPEGRMGYGMKIGFSEGNLCAPCRTRGLRVTHCNQALRTLYTFCSKKLFVLGLPRD